MEAHPQRCLGSLTLTLARLRLCCRRFVVVRRRVLVHPPSHDAASPCLTWTRTGARLGLCLVTIGTPEMTPEEEEHTGLVSNHSYAVLDVREVAGNRLLQLKNPWSHRRWKGAFSACDLVNWTPELRRELDYDQVGEMQSDNGIFWIDYSSLRPPPPHHPPPPPPRHAIRVLDKRA